MHKFLSVLAVAATSAFIAAPASASLINSTVTGGFYAGTNSTNYFDPVYGLVPATGFTNSAANSNSATVSITGSKTEFGFDDTLNKISADFNGGTLVITDISGGSTINTKYVFTDTAFTGLTLTETNDTFLNGGASASLVGTTLTILVPRFDLAGTYSATYSLSAGSTAAAVPEPTSIALLGLGLLSVAASRRKSVKSKNA